MVLVQYLSQIVYRTYQLYESPSTAEAEDAFLAVSIANTTRTGNTTEDQQRAYAVIEDMIAMTASLGNASLSGTLWLLPASVSLSASLFFSCRLDRSLGVSDLCFIALVPVRIHLSCPYAKPRISAWITRVHLSCHQAAHLRCVSVGDFPL